MIMIAAWIIKLLYGVAVVSFGNAGRLIYKWWVTRDVDYVGLALVNLIVFFGTIGLIISSH